MRYMIHATPERMWYVNDYLLPSMVKQGIPEDEIKVWNDENHVGNLLSCIKSFTYCGEFNGAVWHLQDDVVICRDFYERTKKFSKSDIVCGFCGKGVGPDPDNIGDVKPYNMWWSFQCIQIPNDLAGGCVKWFEDDAMHRTDSYIAERIAGGKSDDWIFRRFLLEAYPYTKVINVSPNLVEHIDYLLGGSLINKQRKRIHTSAHFKDKDFVEELERRLKNNENVQRVVEL